MDEGDERLTAGDDPAIHHIVRPRGGRIVAKVDAKLLADDGNVGEEEAERVEPGQEHGRDDVPDAVLAEAQVLAPDDGRVDEEEPDRVGAVLVDDRVGVRVVLQALAHLAAILGQDEAADDQVLPGRRAEQVDGEHEERVEPAASLIPEHTRT